MMGVVGRRVSLVLLPLNPLQNLRGTIVPLMRNFVVLSPALTRLDEDTHKEGSIKEIADFRFTRTKVSSEN